MNMQGLSDICALIVDDEKEMRHVLKDILQDIGIGHFFEAGDVKGALHILKTSYKRIDIVLCDWNLPGQSGLDLRAEMEREEIKCAFLIVSGRGDHDSVLTAKNAGVAGYIRKPFSPYLVETRILIALQRMKNPKVCEQ